MDNFTPSQYDRYEAYRRQGLPKQAVRKVRSPSSPVPTHCAQQCAQVIQQTTGQSVSQPVAQIVAGFSKLFVGEIVEKGTWMVDSVLGKVLDFDPAHIARQVQARRGETGPLSPDHLREAYRMYQEETGRVGAARPIKSKRLFMR